MNAECFHPKVQVIDLETALECVYQAIEEGRKAGSDNLIEQASANGQKKQSPWHEASEEPKKGEHICVQVGSGNLTSWYAPSNIRKAFEDYNVIRWAYVSDLIKPTTQSINS